MTRGWRKYRYALLLACDCGQSADQSLDDGELISVRVLPLAALGERLQQSYHQLTWYKALAHL